MAPQPARTALPFYRLAHDPQLRRSPYKPWKPAVELGVTAGLFLVLQIAYVVVFLIVGAGNGYGIDWLEKVLFAEEADGDPAEMLFTYGAIAVTVLAAIGGALAGGRDPASLVSVAGRVRWKVVGTSLGWVAAPVAACLAVDVLVHGGVPAAPDRGFWLALAVWTAVIPVQCLAEELIFRGVLPQALGAWLRSPLAAFGVSLPFFVLGHTYGLGGLVGVACFAAVASVLVHRTGGIEATVVLHCTNNLALSYLDISGLTALPEEAPRRVLATVVLLLQYAGALVLLVALRRYAPHKRLPPPGWFGGSGWYRGWPLVVLRFRTPAVPVPAAAPARRPLAPTVSPQAFHRTFRPWWRALVEAVVLAVLFLAINIGAVMVLVGSGLALGLPDTFADLNEADLDANVMALIAIAMTCAAPIVAARVSGRRPTELISVTSRFRWKLALPATAAAAVVHFALYALSVRVDGPPEFAPTARGLAFIVVCLLVVPIQAAAEELIFRAAIPQIVGAWVRSPLIAYGAGVPLFVVGHAYDWVGLTDIAVFAVCAAALTWYTKGIEAATALHAVNNIVAFSTLGLGGSEPTSYEVDPVSAAWSIAGTLAATAATVWAVRKVAPRGAKRLTGTVTDVKEVPRAQLEETALHP